MNVPVRGLRRPVPGRTTSGATRVVGLHGEALLAVYADPDASTVHRDQLLYGTLLPGLDELRKRARGVGFPRGGSSHRME